MKKFFTSSSIKQFGLIVLPIVWSISSCSTSNTYNDEIIVVEAFRKTLSLDSISTLIPDNMSYEDSILFSDRIINSWIREQVMLAQAEKSLSDQYPKFERQIQTYRNSLLVSEYESSYVDSRLNRVVTEEEITEFHNLNPELFKLSEHVVRAVFVHLPEEEVELDSVKFWLSEADSITMPNLEKWCIEHGANYAIDTEYWWLISDLLNQIPMQIYRIEDQLKRKKIIEFNDNGRTFLLKILDHRLKNLPSPLAISRDRIVEIILQERRRTILENLRDELVKEAWALGQISRDSIQL